ncbi:hypothetical protein ACQKGC_01940, partial [Allorhizobium pseudoryzae]
MTSDITELSTTRLILPFGRAASLEFKTRMPGQPQSPCPLEPRRHIVLSHSGSVRAEAPGNMPAWRLKAVLKALIEPKACRAKPDSVFRFVWIYDSFAHGRRSAMGKPHPMELRERVVAFVNEGNSNREAARHFRVSPRFVN